MLRRKIIDQGIEVDVTEASRKVLDMTTIPPDASMVERLLFLGDNEFVTTPLVLLTLDQYRKLYLELQDTMRTSDDGFNVTAFTDFNTFDIEVVNYEVPLKAVKT